MFKTVGPENASWRLSRRLSANMTTVHGKTFGNNNNTDSHGLATSLWPKCIFRQAVGPQKSPICMDWDISLGLRWNMRLADAPTG